MTTQPTHWNENADKFDAQVGDDGDAFRKNLIYPATLRLLSPQAGERILDAACGNGNFSRKLAKLDCEVVAFDYSPALIAHAMKYGSLERIAYSVCDATDYAALKALGGGKPFDKAVCNMALMDIPDIEPLFRAVYEMLTPGGVFVFSLIHPCFISPGNRLTEDGMGVIVTDYMEEKMHVINGEIPQHHRPLSALLNTCFKSGFVLDGVEETTFAPGATSHGVREKVPYVLVLRVRKRHEKVD
jgi:2-polyprenyl-3-methyl-5-hydroxy-6-metoxy-1,4-benzoquinol methylase